MEGAWGRVDPWSRLGWQVPLATLLTLLGLMSFLRVLEPPPGPSPASRPFDVQVVELPPAIVAPPPAAPKPETRPVPPPARDRRPIERRSDGTPPPPRAEPRTTPLAPEGAPPLPATEVATPSSESRESIAPPPLVAVPQPAAPPDVAAGPSRRDADRPPRALEARTEAPRNPVPGTRGGTLEGGSAGARAIYQPVPEIPETLRHRAIEITAVARFRVAANGTAQVELTEPTADPDLNRAVLDTLKRWRFFPAMEDGKLVPATVDIRIPISVK
jgi:protein TonB